MQAERQHQHRFERELQERDRRLKQQEKAFVRMNGLQQTLETHILAWSTNRCHGCCVHLALQLSYQLPVINFTSLHHILALAGYVHIILTHKKLLFAFFLQKHQDEVCQLQERLRERSKENRRLKRNFDSIKELNDNMKKQVNSVYVNDCLNWSSMCSLYQWQVCQKKA